MAKQNPRQFWKRVRRDGRWVTINTKTGKEVTRKDRIAAKDADRQDRRDADEKQRKPLRERTVWSDELTDKGKLQTVHKSNKTYRKETSKWGDGDGDADRMTPEQQKKSLKISKKRDLTNIPVEKKSNKLKVNNNKDESSSSSSSSSSANNESKEQFLKRTRNSPAAKAGLSDAQRWTARQNYLKWKSSRKKKKK